MIIFIHLRNGINIKKNNTKENTDLKNSNHTLAHVRLQTTQPIHIKIK